MTNARYTHPWFMSIGFAEHSSRTVRPYKRSQESAAFCRLCAQSMTYPATHNIVVEDEEWIVHPDTPPSGRHELTRYGVGPECLKRVEGLRKFLVPKWGEEVPSDPEAPLPVRLFRVHRRAEQWLEDAEEARKALADYLKAGYADEREAAKALSDILFPDFLDEYLISRTKASAARRVLKLFAEASADEVRLGKLRTLCDELKQIHASRIFESTLPIDSPAERALADSGVTGLSDVVKYLEAEGF